MTKAKIELMYQLFGKCDVPEATCSLCCHLKSYQASRKYYKCNCYGNTRSQATDWKKSNPACGLWNQSYVGSDIIEYKKHMSRKSGDVHCKGQMELFDANL